jgi:hypothetical protein
LRIDGPDDAAPRVTQVLTRSTGWGDNFLGQLAERELGFGGFAIGSGPQQLGAMPWQNVNEVVIRFSEDVNVQARDLVLEGVNLPVISEVGFSYDPESFEATWTLAGPLPTDKLLIDLSDAVTDEAGNRLDGEWINPSEGEAAPPPSDFPSGDGQPGGNFRFRFNLARGDSNGDGSISVLDIAPLRNAIGQSVGSEGYDPLADYNADGANSVLDIPNLRDNIGQALPEGDPRDPDFPEDVPFDQGVGETPTREQPVVDEPNRDTADLLAGPTSAVRASAGPESAAAMQTALISQQRRSIDASRHGNADAENQGGLDARGTDDLGDGLLDSLLRDPEEDEATLDALRLANEQLNR